MRSHPVNGKGTVGPEQNWVKIGNIYLSCLRFRWQMFLYRIKGHPLFKLLNFHVSPKHAFFHFSEMRTNDVYIGKQFLIFAKSSQHSHFRENIKFLPNSYFFILPRSLLLSENNATF
jgi:hypothetical protein